MEYFKELDDDNLQEVLNLINMWYYNQEIPEEVLLARVVLIFKKGDTANLKNYRPISLLNAIYKLLAAMIQVSLADKMEGVLQKTQYGFRKNRSTADAIHVVRRMIARGESTNEELHLVLLDWEKAFDKIYHHKLIEALERLNIPEEIIGIIKAMYTNTKFFVKMDGKESKIYTQHSGIRQGCPLSPYLFIMIMTVMCHDIHENDALNISGQRPEGLVEDQVLYADDTICITKTVAAMNKLVKAMMKEKNMG